MSHFTSPEEFMEKLGAQIPPAPSITPGIKTKWLGLGATIHDIGNWWKNLGPRGKSIALGATALGMGAGATGLLGALGGDRPADTISYRINRAIHSLTDRIRADETLAESFARQLGKQTSESLVGLTRDVLTKGYETMKDTFALSPVRQQIFGALRKEDPIIGDADSRTLMEAYHTMSNVAPELSTDKNAVKSVLRMAATSGSGLDYTTIKGIADAEIAVNKAKAV